MLCGATATALFEMNQAPRQPPCELSLSCWDNGKENGNY